MWHFTSKKKVCSALDILHSTHYANSELKGHKTHFNSKKPYNFYISVNFSWNHHFTVNSRFQEFDFVEISKIQKLYFLPFFCCKFLRFSYGVFLLENLIWHWLAGVAQGVCTTSARRFKTEASVCLGSVLGYSALYWFFVCMFSVI